MVNGSVMDISSSGSTYFIEPTASAKIREELSVLEIEESNEERKILYKLTALVSEHDFQFHLNIEALETLDFIFAKAKLSQDMKAVPAEIVLERRIEICEGRHPLLNPLECVPLNFTLGNGISGVVITGPNTGGKNSRTENHRTASANGTKRSSCTLRKGQPMYAMIWYCAISETVRAFQKIYQHSPHISQILSTF